MSKNESKIFDDSREMKGRKRKHAHFNDRSPKRKKTKLDFSQKYEDLDNTVLEKESFPRYSENRGNILDAFNSSQSKGSRICLFSHSSISSVSNLTTSTDKTYIEYSKQGEKVKLTHSHMSREKKRKRDRSDRSPLRHKKKKKENDSDSSNFETKSFLKNSEKRMLSSERYHFSSSKINEFSFLYRDDDSDGTVFKNNSERLRRSSAAGHSFKSKDSSISSPNKSSMTNSTLSVNSTFHEFSYNVKSNEEKRKILKRIEYTRLYSSLVDIETIVRDIDERIIGKHDDWIHAFKRRIYILGDSHTRFLVFGLQQILPGFTVESFCKPSAKCEQVLFGMEGTISSLTKKDFLIIICGTNDTWGTSVESAMKCITSVLKKTRNTNILMCDLPQNYSVPGDSHVQDNRNQLNDFIKKAVKKNKYAKLIKLRRLKDKAFFTKHGLHFNATGKIKICELLSHKLLDKIDKLNR